MATMISTDQEPSPDPTPDSPTPAMASPNPSPASFPSADPQVSTQSALQLQNSAPTQSSDTPASRKLKRKTFRFLETYDMFLLRAVRANDAHIPDRGQADTLYQKVHTDFMDQCPSVVFKHLSEPSCKTLADQFKRIAAQSREAVKRTARTSGIIEKHGDKEVLLDDLIHEMDAKEELLRAEKDARTENEKRLIDAGENIRVLSLKRAASPGDNMAVTGSERKKKRSNRLENADPEDEVNSSLLSQAADRRDAGKKRLDVDIKRLEIERERVQREKDRFEATQQANNRRLLLDEKRFELDKEERKQQMEERKQMVGVLELLAKKQ